jgi:hypothetical protein
MNAALDLEATRTPARAEWGTSGARAPQESEEAPTNVLAAFAVVAGASTLFPSLSALKLRTRHIAAATLMLSCSAIPDLEA